MDESRRRRCVLSGVTSCPPPKRPRPARLVSRGLGVSLGLFSLGVLACRDIPAHESAAPAEPAKEAGQNQSASNSSRAQTAGGFEYPDLRQPAPEMGATPGRTDTAVVVSAHDYYQLPDIPGADVLGESWVSYFTYTLGIPITRIRKLDDIEVTPEKILQNIAELRSEMPSGGRLWFVFIGHGMGSADGQAHLLMHTAPKDADMVSALGASLSQQELIHALEGRVGIQPIAILDTCYSGSDREGSPLRANMGGAMDVREVEPKTALILTAAGARQTAGWLPDSQLPAFSYMLLGGLRGWADQDRDGKVNDIELHKWTRDHVRMLTDMTNEQQVPERRRAGETLEFAVSSEPGPDFRRLLVPNAPVELTNADSHGPVHSPVQPSTELQNQARPVCGSGRLPVEGGTLVDHTGAQRRVAQLCVDVHEITVNDYARCVTAGVCAPAGRGKGCNAGHPERGDHPINCISWTNADQYCQMSGARLPSEWEWEWIARGGEEAHRFPWGNTPEPSCEHVVMHEQGRGCGMSRTWPVGSKSAGNTEDGIADLAGQVWEWTASWYDDTRRGRTIRGGSWSSNEPERFDVHERTFEFPAVQSRSVGARCVSKLP